ncbi:uncharacterized protein LOC143368360 [Andrena cerasifolii]|uniref:uncharacterized protein LOC143368360 n=1 Tax=Andrena cerasifolii TaxID=2819439 RepID=UPI004037900E
MMDNCCAPQWADFTHSPQLLSDSYFEIEHDVHGPFLHFKTDLKSNFFSQGEEGRAQGSTVVESCFTDSLESGENPQPNVAYFIPQSNRKTPLKEANDDPGLRKSMTNLRLDEKSRKIHCTWNVSLGGQTSTTLFKDKVEAPERFRKSVRTSESKSTVLRKSIRNNRAVKDVKEETNAQSASLKDTSKPIINSKVDRCSKYTKPDIPRKRLSHGVRRRQSESFRRCSLGKSQAKVLTCQYRRRSLLKYRRCSNEFVSMAEAVLKFENAVPQRFRTISHKDLKPGPLMKLKRSPLKLTQPISPALRCKQRSRQTTILRQKGREALEPQEMKKRQIKAKPVPVNILKAPSKLKEVVKKPNTITEEFRLTQPKKTHHTTGPRANPLHAVDDKDCNRKTAAPIARVASPSNIVKNEKCTEQATENTAKSVKNCLPSSFEARNKLFQKKREENLKNQQVQEVKKVTTEFHAKPAPNFLKSRKSSKEQNVKRTVVACPFSFAERDKDLAKKKEQHIKEMQEQDKKPRVFHANPVPSFKPVMVRGLSKGNLRSKEKLPTSPKHLAARGTKNCNDQENKQPNIIPNPATCANAKKDTKRQDAVKKQCKTLRRTHA